MTVDDRKTWLDGRYCRQMWLLDARGEIFPCEIKIAPSTTRSRVTALHSHEEMKNIRNSPDQLELHSNHSIFFPVPPPREDSDLLRHSVGFIIPHVEIYSVYTWTWGHHLRPLLWPVEENSQYEQEIVLPYSGYIFRISWTPQRGTQRPWPPVR